MNISKSSSRGFIKLALAIIGLVVVLSFLGVQMSVLQNIGLLILNQIVLPVIEKIKDLL